MTDLEFYMELIRRLGDDPTRAGLQRTPARVQEAFAFLTSGYRINIEDELRHAIFDEKYDEMVLVKHISFFSLCEHHLLPFFGKIHVAYIPSGRVIGPSKIPRIVDAFSRRLQLQERMTAQIADCLMRHLRPWGVGVVCEAMHLCMAMRGVRYLRDSGDQRENDWRAERGVCRGAGAWRAFCACVAGEVAHCDFGA